VATDQHDDFGANGRGFDPKAPVDPPNVGEPHRSARRRCVAKRGWNSAASHGTEIQLTLRLSG
jgi:hypothetical protein